MSLVRKENFLDKVMSEKKTFRLGKGKKENWCPKSKLLGQALSEKKTSRTGFVRKENFSDKPLSEELENCAKDVRKELVGQGFVRKVNFSDKVLSEK